MKRFLITGPESTGKSELALALANYHGGIYVPEYARTYIENLEGPYVYKDVEHIAKRQLEDYENALKKPAFTFFDTWLIVTKVWFEVVYGKVPVWIENRVKQASFDLVLLCDTDIPWIPDQVRENGGEKREGLMDRYKSELDRLGFDWELVSGLGSERFDRARKLINNKIKNDRG